MEFICVGAKFLHEKNISYQYTVNRYKLNHALRGCGTLKLSDVSLEITDGTRVRRVYTSRGIRIISVGDFEDGKIYKSSLKYIAEEGIKEKDFIKENDVLITAVGNSGQAIRVTSELEDCIISSDVIRIRLKHPSNSFGLVAYLNSEVGKLAIDSIKSGVINRLSIYDVKEILIPSTFDDFIKNEVLTKENQRDNKLYEKCVKLFMRYVKLFDEMFEDPKFIFTEPTNLDSDRLDSKHYTYTGSRLYKTIHTDTDNVKWQPLGNIIEIKKAIRPTMDENKEVDYINISNIDEKNSIIKSNETDLFTNLSSRIRYVLEEGELISAKSGSATGTRRHASAIVTTKYKGMMASDAFYNFKVLDINPYYLLFLLKQMIVIKQIDAGSIGQIFKTINRREFENILIPRLHSSVEGEISEKMKMYINGNS